MKIQQIKTAILEEMARREWTIAEMCRHAGMKHHTVRKWLHGQSEIRIDTIERLLVLLDPKIIPGHMLKRRPVRKK